MTPEQVARHAGRAAAPCTASEFDDTATLRALGAGPWPTARRGAAKCATLGVVKYKVGAERVQTLPFRVLRLGRLVGRTRSAGREPKGIAHAVDPSTGTVACGVDPSTLTVMDQDWEAGPLTRCGPCRAAIAKRDKAGR